MINSDKLYRGQVVIKLILFVFFLVKSFSCLATVKCSSDDLRHEYLSVKLVELFATPRENLEAFLINMTHECGESIIQDPKIQLGLDDRFEDLYYKLKQQHEFETSELEEILNYKFIGANELSIASGTNYQKQRQKLTLLNSEKLLSKDKCQNTDLRSTLPPIRDQDSVGWCYAYLAADLVSQKSGKNISAVELALNYRRHRSMKEFFEVGLNELKNRVEIGRASCRERV